MKKISKILIAILAVLSLTVYCLYDTFLVEPRKYHVRNETLSSDLIPQSLDDVTILYFSDLDYGTFMDEKRLESLVSKINHTGADLVIFGGDLYDTEAAVDETMQTTVSSLLSQIDVPLGKFAVYGDFDNASEERRQRVYDTLQNGGFEILNNRSVNIRNKSTDSITLIGIDDGLNGIQDITGAYSTVSHSNYAIAICHTPDTADLVPSDITDYFLAGHSHGGQIYWLFGAYYGPDKAVEHFRGKENIASSFTLDITNGVGTTGTDARLFANAEIVLYRLHSTHEPVHVEETKTETTTSDDAEVIVPDAIQPTDEPTESSAGPDESQNESN